MSQRLISDLWKQLSSPASALRILTPPSVPPSLPAVMARTRRIRGYPHRIWDIPEVVENILLFLPMRDLLLDQRVCTRWQNVIQAAPRLQQALFFRPVSNLSVGKDGRIERESNSILEATFPAWFPKLLVYGEHRIADSPWATKLTRLAILRRDASWRRMFTAQPPLTVWEEAHGKISLGEHSLHTGSMEVREGVRMGLVYDRTAGSTAHTFVLVSDGSIPNLTTEEQADLDPEDFAEYLAKYPSDEEKSKWERVFAGEGILTLVIKSLMWSRKTSGFLSVGAEDVDIELKEIPEPADVHVFGSHGWWTDDGYLRPPLS